jgi:hypothetical protein
MEDTVQGRDIDTVLGRMPNMPNMPKATVFTHVGE